MISSSMLVYHGNSSESSVSAKYTSLAFHVISKFILLTCISYASDVKEEKIRLLSLPFTFRYCFVVSNKNILREVTDRKSKLPHRAHHFVAL